MSWSTLQKAAGELLQQMDYSLQGNAKESAGIQRPDRDARFRHLCDEVDAHLAQGQLVISVGSVKKQVVGNVKNGGRESQPGGLPMRVEVHDFFDSEVGKAFSERHQLAEWPARELQIDRCNPFRAPGIAEWLAAWMMRSSSR